MALAVGAVLTSHRADSSDPAISAEVQPVLMFGRATQGCGQAHIGDPSHQGWRCRPVGETMAVSPESDVTAPSLSARVAVVMGSDSDLPTMEPAAAILRQLGVTVEVRVLSAHRTPLEMVAFAEQAHGRGYPRHRGRCRWCSASPRHGGGSHDPSCHRGSGAEPCFVWGGFTPFNCADARWYSLWPRWRLEEGLNAGLLAAQILATSDNDLTQRLADYRSSLHDGVVAKDARSIWVAALIWSK